MNCGWPNAARNGPFVRQEIRLTRSQRSDECYESLAGSRQTLFGSDLPQAATVGLMGERHAMQVEVKSQECLRPKRPSRCFAPRLVVSSRCCAASGGFAWRKAFPQSLRWLPLDPMQPQRARAVKPNRTPGWVRSGFSLLLGGPQDFRDRVVEGATR